MADKPTSQLTDAGTLASQDLYEVVRVVNGVPTSYRTTGAAIVALIASIISGG